MELHEEEFHRATPFLSLQLQELMARDVLGNQAYFEIINDENDALQEAIHLLQKENAYQEVLKGSDNQGKQL